MLDMVEIRTAYSVLDIESPIKSTIYRIEMKFRYKYYKTRNCLRICDAGQNYAFIFFWQKYKKMKSLCTLSFGNTRTEETIKYCSSF